MSEVSIKSRKRILATVHLTDIGKYQSEKQEQEKKRKEKRILD